MPYSDNDKNDAYSWINVVIILSCIAILGYSVYYFACPNQPTIADPQALEKKLLDKEVAEQQSQSVIITENKTSNADLVTEAEIAPPQIEVIEATPADNLPLLNESDPLVLENIEQFSQQSLITPYLLSQSMLRSAVVFIDNFSRGDFIAQFSLLKPPTQAFMVIKSDGKLFIDPRSYQRYDNYANYISSIDSQLFSQSYQLFQPLIDQAYQEIAYPDSHFNDAFYAAITLLLDTPIITYPIELYSPSVMYLYKDPALENLNAAQKLLLRMGPDNLIKIKKKFREIQSELESNE